MNQQIEQVHPHWLERTETTINDSKRLKALRAKHIAKSDRFAAQRLDARILEALRASRDPMRVSELVELTRLPESTVAASLQALADISAIEFDGKRWRAFGSRAPLKSAIPKPIGTLVAKSRKPSKTGLKRQPGLRIGGIACACTQEMQDKIVELIEAGMSRKGVAVSLNKPDESVSRWIRNIPALRYRVAAIEAEKKGRKKCSN